MTAKIAILGASGYTGAELIRLISTHGGMEIAALAANSKAGMRMADVFPFLRHLDLPELVTIGDIDWTGIDLCFCALPHKTSQEVIAGLPRDLKIVDLSADFRLRDPAAYKTWYGNDHTAADLQDEAVYGLTEFYRDRIREARLVANPGCYPTAVQLGFLPLLEAGVVDPGRLFASAVSGATGAGRKERVNLLLAEAADSMRAYGASGHRHHAEVVQGLRHAGAQAVGLVFVPHLAPMVRGIHATIYAELTTDVDVQAVFERYYAREPFVDVMPPESHPETRSVRGANQCRLAVHRPEARRVVVLAVLDNLVKGAAGQAVQNLNLMCGFEETEGLQHVALSP